MGSYVDILLILLIAFILIFNTVRGFVSSLVPFRKWAALVMAWMIKGRVGELIYAMLPNEKWQNSIYNSVYSTFGEKINSISSDSGVTAESYDGVFGFLENMIVGLKELCVQAAVDGVSDVAHTVSVFISETVVRFIAQVIAFAVLFIVLLLGLTVALKILEALCENTFLGTINHILGAAVGALASLITVWIISVVLYFFLPDMISDSTIASWLSNDFFLSKFFGLGTPH